MYLQNVTTRVPDLREDWCRFLTEGRPREFRTAAATVVRIPFWAWIGQHAARGALSLNLPAEAIPSGSNDLRMDLLLLVRRLAAAWTVSGSSLPHGQFVASSLLKNTHRSVHFAGRIFWGREECGYGDGSARDGGTAGVVCHV
jgi:hypothetical protein